MAEQDREQQFYVPQSPDEALEIRKRIRDAIDKRALAAAEKFAEQAHALRASATGFSADYGKIFVRTAFLLNGGAILALLTFVGSLFGKADTLSSVAINFAQRVSGAFGWYVGGLVAIAGAAAIGYFNWMIIANAYPGESALYNLIRAKPVTPPKNRDVSIKWSMRLGVFLAFVSLACFCAGSLIVGKAFRVLGVV